MKALGFVFRFLWILISAVVIALLLVPDFRTRIHDLLTVPVVPVQEQIACRGAGAVLKRGMDVLVAPSLDSVVPPVNSDR